MKAIFIAWEAFHARTEFLGQAVGARIYYISRLGRVSGPRLLLKYILQSLDTLAILVRERPEVVIVQTPPVFAALLPTLYSLVFRRTRVIIDAHSGNFISRKWAWALPLHRWCSRRARVTLVHMRSLRPLIESWGAPALDLGYWFDETPPPGEPYAVAEGFNVASPTSFNDDEPIEVIFKAARLLPDVSFYLTGNVRRVPPEVMALKPENVRFTGFLPHAAYYGLLRSVDAVLALTTQDQTFQTGGGEAIWLGRPLIISDWPELRQVFSTGAIYVANTPAGIASGVRAAQADRTALEHGARQLKHELDRALQNRLSTLRALIEQDPRAPGPHLGDWAADKEKSR